MRKQQFLWIPLAAGTALCFLPSFAQGAPYDLAKVNGIQAFGGSASARELLARNGFVVADPAFKQIFEPYIKSPQTAEPSETNPTGTSLPSFITTDSAWDTYHVLLEEGVKEMEETRSRTLLDFSRRLLAAASDPKIGDSNLVLFASVGRALQDGQYRQSLEPGARRIVDGLRSEAEQIESPIGFPLSPLQFRAQSFYTQSPELTDYFAARQWYASVVFRLSNTRETKSAVILAMLVNANPQLLALWKQLSDPYDRFLAPAEDGTIHEYADAAAAILGSKLSNVSIPDAQITEIQKKLEAQLPLPQVSDQLLSPGQYAEFPGQTRGFRLLPPRRLPCAACFHDTTDPKIPGRAYPSGLDFMAASPLLRSPAAIRAVQSQFGKDVGGLILKTDCGPMPDSLHGEAMQLLATLQKPLPPQAPAPMRTEAWSDLQLWTQLGAWAEQRHTWALHTKLTEEVLGMISPPRGMVAPYPEFFTGLAKLTRRTADAFGQAGLEERFDAKTVAGELLEMQDLSQKRSLSRDEKEYEKNSAKLVQYVQFQQRYYEKHQAELKNGGSHAAYQRIQNGLEDLARRCAANGATNQADLETLQLFFDCRQDITRLLNDFAPVCDRLAGLARKSLAGLALTEDDANWIENYGVTLAGFHFYYGNSYEVPRDDFPIVTRVFSSPSIGSMLYAGLARPQALYVIVPDGKSLQLYRGAVMTYREFVRPNEQLLDDESWRQLILNGQAPPAPPFTRSFYAETSVGELLKKLKARSQNEDADYQDTEDIFWQIASRATSKDLPELFEMLANSREERDENLVNNLADIIVRLPWELHQRQLVEMLASSNNILADRAAYILITRPAALDVTNFIAGFPNQSPRARRLYCAILGHLPQPAEATRKLLLQALHDPSDGVRWQAVMAIGQAGWNDAQSQSALLAALEDTNQFVGAAAAFSLARLGATNTAPALFTQLKTELQSTNTPVEELERQSKEVLRDIIAVSVLDPDNLRVRLYISAEVTANVRRRSAMRLPPQPYNFPTHNYDLTTALIEALGDLGYVPAADELSRLNGGDYDVEATRALGKLVPDRLAGQLIATAKDRQVDSYLREKALVTLSSIAATNRVRELIPLLDDTTPIEYSRPLPGPEWRVCDRVAETIATMLGWQNRMTPVFIRYEQREETMNRVRDWAKQTQ